MSVFLKPGWHLNISIIIKIRSIRKKSMAYPLGLTEIKQQKFFFVSSLVQLFAYAWTMILCLCLRRSLFRRIDFIPLFCLLFCPYAYAYAYVKVWIRLNCKTLHIILRLCASAGALCKSVWDVFNLTASQYSLISSFALTLQTFNGIIFQSCIMSQKSVFLPPYCLGKRVIILAVLLWCVHEGSSSLSKAAHRQLKFNSSVYQEENVRDNITSLARCLYAYRNLDANKLARCKQW